MSKEKITNASPQNERFYTFGSTAGNRDALNSMATSFNGIDTIQRATASRYYDYSNLAPNISGRPGLTKADYNKFRPGEATPTAPKEVMAFADMIYRKVGLVKNVIDLMGDFGSTGIRVVHPNKRIEKLGRNWFKGRSGAHVSERFLNYFYRNGNVFVRRMTAIINEANGDRLYKSVAAADMVIQKPEFTKREIPWRYIFLNPISMDIVGGPLAAFSQNPQYAIKLPMEVQNAIRNPRNYAERALVESLPADIRDAATSSDGYIVDSSKLITAFYRKDDWAKWADPMISGIMDDISILEKLKLSDLAALDGAISNLRIIRLGDIEKGIFPTKAAFSKISKMLESHTGVGTIDIVWSKDIDMLESKTTVHQFLGEEKYKPHLNSIYAGLGIPPTLTGTFGAAGTTNNLVSLKTMVQRLEYGREALRDFWERELAILQKALNIRFPFKIEFAHMDLGDSDALKALLVQLSDRNLISDELLQYQFKHDPEMETIRINRETKARSQGRMVQKSGAFYDPQFEIAFKKIALQTGVATPSQIGLDLPKQKAGEILPAALKLAKPAESSGPTGVSGQGRPKNSNDTQKRKTKTFKPKVKASLEIWVNQAQNTVAEVINEKILAEFDKKNMRSLTADEQQIAEDIKFGVLSHLEAFSEVNNKTIGEALAKGSPPDNMIKTYKIWANDISVNINRKLTLDELRKVQSSVYINNIEGNI